MKVCLWPVEELDKRMWESELMVSLGTGTIEYFGDSVLSWWME